jgi:hypothetical protein
MHHPICTDQAACREHGGIGGTDDEVDELRREARNGTHRGREAHGWPGRLLDGLQWVVIRIARWDTDQIAEE